MRRKIPMLEEAFTGHFTDHHAFLLAKKLARVDELDADIAELDTRIEAESRPLADQVERLDAIPGIDRTAAHTIIGDVGVDLSPPRAPGLLGAVRPRGEGIRREAERPGRHRTWQPVPGPSPR